MRPSGIVSVKAAGAEAASDAAERPIARDLYRL